MSLELLKPYVDPLMFIAREKWDALPPKGPGVRMTHPIYYLNCYCCDVVGNHDKEAVRNVQKLHMEEKGYNDIDCNFIIGRDGKVYVARDWFVRPEIHNKYQEEEEKNYLSIAFVGQVEGKSEEDPQIAKLFELLEYAIANKYLDEDYELFGENKNRGEYKNVIDLDKYKGDYQESSED